METCRFISEHLKEGDDIREVQKLFRPLRIDVNWNKDGLFYILNNQKGADFTNPMVRECNGLIFSRKTHKLVAMGLPYMTTYTEDMDLGSLDQYRVEDMHDGSLMRLYCYSGVWLAATSRCYDARLANWQNNETFGTLFNDALILHCKETEGAEFSIGAFNNQNSAFFKNLNSDYTYFFMLRHPRNRIVYPCDQPELIHIATYNRVTLEETVHDIGLSPAPSCRTVGSAEDLRALISTMDDEGIMLINKANGERIKVYSNSYSELKALKGNTQNVNMLLLERQHEGNLEKLLSHFPEYTQANNILQNKIRVAAENIYRMYLSTYIPGRRYNYHYSKEYEIPVADLHRGFEETKAKVTLNTVIACLKGYSPSILSFILGGFGSEVRKAHDNYNSYRGRGRGKYRGH